MEKKKFYFASPVFHERDLIERWVQYDSFGQIDHNIFVSQRKVLVFSVTDEKGETKFYSYPRGERVFEKNYASSYSTESGPWENEYSGPYCDANGPSQSYDKHPDILSYFVPIEEYFSLSSEVTSPTLARLYLRLANYQKKGYVKLSMDEEEAKKQIEDIKVRKSSQEKTLVKTR